MSSRPILLLGPATPVRGRTHEILIAAGYRVVIADSPADALQIAMESAARVVVAPLDAAEAWRSLARAVGERLEQAIPVVIVSGGSKGDEAPSAWPHPVSCREPGFGRQLLEEIQYVERTFPAAPAPPEARGSRVGTVPIVPRRAAPR